MPSSISFRRLKPPVKLEPGHCLVRKELPPVGKLHDFSFYKAEYRVKPRVVDLHVPYGRAGTTSLRQSIAVTSKEIILARLSNEQLPEQIGGVLS